MVFFRALADLHKAKQMLDEKDAEISKQRQELETLTTNKGYVHGCGGRTFLYMSLSASWGRCKVLKNVLLQNISPYHWSACLCLALN